MPAAATGSRRVDRRADFLQAAFHRYHRPEFIEPDPLQFLRAYPDILDRELVAALAAGLAYGQVRSIVRSIVRVLDVLGPHPARMLEGMTRSELLGRLSGFRHRWTGVEDMASFLIALSSAQQAWGGLGRHLRLSIEDDDADIHPALQRWVGALRAFGLPVRHSLVPDPARGSACKRLHLMTRWLVRCDEVDPGGWIGISPALLLTPVDVHMHRFGRSLGFTRRRNANLQTAREITAGFRRYAPYDPVRYDFALTRMPIHERMTMSEVRAVVRRSRARLG